MRQHVFFYLWCNEELCNLLGGILSVVSDEEHFRSRGL